MQYKNAGINLPAFLLFHFFDMINIFKRLYCWNYFSVSLYFFNSGLIIVKLTLYTLNPEFRYAEFNSISSILSPSSLIVVIKFGKLLLLSNSKWISKWFERFFKNLSAPGSNDKLHNKIAKPISAIV